MMYILFGIIVGIVITVFLAIYGEKYDYKWYGILAQFVSILLGLCLAIALGMYMIFVYNWTGSKYKADILNREYGTSYTVAEVFYASDVIDTIRELDRKRVEVNGDLMQKKD